LRLDGYAYGFAAWTGVFFDDLTFDYVAPEPSSGVLLLGCASIVACVAWRRRRSGIARGTRPERSGTPPQIRIASWPPRPIAETLNEPLEFLRLVVH
jgi:hypothetical protein